MGRAATLKGEWTDAAETQSAMRAQSQMVCREMERDERSARLKFSGCSEQSARENEDGLRRTLSGEG